MLVSRKQRRTISEENKILRRKRDLHPEFESDSFPELEENGPLILPLHRVLLQQEARLTRELEKSMNGIQLRKVVLSHLVNSPEDKPVGGRRGKTFQLLEYHPLKEIKLNFSRANCPPNPGDADPCPKFRSPDLRKGGKGKKSVGLPEKSSLVQPKKDQKDEGPDRLASSQIPFLIKRNQKRDFYSILGRSGLRHSGPSHGEQTRAPPLTKTQMRPTSQFLSHSTNRINPARARPSPQFTQRSHIHKSVKHLNNCLDGFHGTSVLDPRAEKWIPETQVPGSQAIRPSASARQPLRPLSPPPSVYAVAKRENISAISKHINHSLLTQSPSGPKIISSHVFYRLEHKAGISLKGQVHIARQLMTDLQVFIKRWRVGPRVSDLESIISSIELLQKCQESPYFLKIYEKFIENETLWVVAPVFRARTLDELVRSRQQPLPRQEALLLVYKLGLAMSILQQKSLIHGRLTPRCVLVSDQNDPVVYKLDHERSRYCLDQFNDAPPQTLDEETFKRSSKKKASKVSFRFNKRKTEHKDLIEGVTSGRKLAENGRQTIEQFDQFVAPEVTKNKANLSRKSDVWSLGAIYFYLRFGRPAFPQPQLLLQDLEQGNYFIGGDGVKIRSDEEQLIFRSLQGNPINRIGLDVFLRLQAFDSVRGLVRAATAPPQHPPDQIISLLTDKLGSAGFPNALVATSLKDGRSSHVTACFQRLADEPTPPSSK